MNKDSPTLEDEFARVLVELDTRALLLGGVAVTSYGYARLTEDTDWWIDPTGGSIQWAKRVLDLLDQIRDEFRIMELKKRSMLGRYPKDRGNPDFSVTIITKAESEGVIRIQNETGTVDLFYAANNIRDFETAWRRSLPVGSLRKLSVDDLIASKRGTRRQKDSLDIQFLQTLKKDGATGR